MARKNRTTPDKRIWTAYLIIGVLLMAGVAFFSSWRAMRTAEERFCQTLEFVKSQSTSFEKHNDTITAKALRRTAECLCRDGIVVLFKAGGLGFDKLKGLAKAFLCCAHCPPAGEKSNTGHQEHADDQIGCPYPFIRGGSVFTRQLCPPPDTAKHFQGIGQ